MRCGWIVVAGMLVGAPVAAQQSELSPTESDAASAVSIDRIRKGLAEPDHPLADRLTQTPDFKSQVVEEPRMSDIVKSLNFRAGPTPFGGLYQYEQQRLLFNPLDYPFMQPYAAFNGGQLITLAFESILGSYLAPKALASLAGSRRAEAEAAAHEEVMRAISRYCAAQPHRGSGIVICEDPSAAR